MRFLLGLLISTGIGIVAYRRRSLSRSGVFGAILTGTTIFGFGGFAPGALLVAFFVSSSLLSKFKADTRAKRNAAAQFDKGGRRDIWQALANGGAAAGLACAFGLAEFFAQPELARLCYAGMLGALATVTADTWATELGVLNRTQPRLITTFKPVAPGTSGALSLIGTLAALAGAAFIGLWYLVFGAVTGTDPIAPAYVSLIVLAGFAGALSDSLLGATLQARYFNDARQLPTERASEADGVVNTHTGGWRWLTNDWVNFLSSLSGAGLALLLTM